ncbi:FAD-dependent oxidoreductase [Sporohalobacter salinus]|uniref:FAD-dependent oxidoreductase n=1 Tax=Sporohalobacter salinus TaxID=1494606 RepID=UPI0019618395|nr:FAD-dependent oxidoreductase [Sporohalobacter salinus]MBM7623680.1 dihydropyrimidine dehydrogenase (NAD+) subunit PreT [Sporohalobacter salinus]
MSYFNYDQAMKETSRCLLCYDAPCSQGCPANTNPAKFIRSIRFENLRGAAEIIRNRNILGGICARVCPYDRLCQENCVRDKLDESIQIGKLQEFICDYEREADFEVIESVDLIKEKIAVIGSGPAGLAAAGELALNGYQVTVFERRSLIGGWLSYGIPSDKLPQEIVNHEIKYIKDLGVEFKTNCEIGKDISFNELEEQDYSAYLLALGKPVPKTLDLEGSQLNEVTNAVDFLSKAKNNRNEIKVKNKKVIIIGGGNVAVDCALIAKEFGAKDVSMVCIESLAEMPADQKDMIKAQKRNVNIFAGFKPQEICGDNNVEKFKGVSVDDSSVLELDYDVIIFAVGQKSADVKQIKDLNVDDDGFILIDENLKTDHKNIFAAGDIIKTDNTVVNAIADGKEAND